MFAVVISSRLTRERKALKQGTSRADGKYVTTETVWKAGELVTCEALAQMTGKEPMGLDMQHECIVFR